MNSNKIKYFLFLPILGLIIFFIFKNKYVEFEPLIFENDTYRNVKVDDTFYKNLEMVFIFNEVDYKTSKEGKILVNRSLTNNLEMSYNYTKKAFDTAWINSHHKSELDM